MPPVPAAGVPLERAGAVAVVDERHARRQRAGPRDASASGTPVVVTVNVPGVPTVNVVAFALVNAGACSPSA